MAEAMVSLPKKPLGKLAQNKNNTCNLPNSPPGLTSWESHPITAQYRLQRLSSRVTHPAKTVPCLSHYYLAAVKRAWIAQRRQISRTQAWSWPGSEASMRQGHALQPTSTTLKEAFNLCLISAAAVSRVSRLQGPSRRSLCTPGRPE